MRRLGGLLALLLGLVLLAVGTVLAVVGTEPGTRWLLDRATRFAPGEVSIASSSGTLLGRLRLEGVEVRSGPQRLAVDRLELSWRPSALARGWLHLEALEAAGVRYRGPAPEPPAEPATRPPWEVDLPDLEAVQLPLRVRIDRLDILDVDIGVGEGEPVVIHRASLAATVDEDGLVLERFELAMAGVDARAEGRMALAPPFGLGLSGEWRWRPVEEGPTLVGDLVLVGDAGGLSLEHRLEGAGRLTTRLHVDLDKPQAQFELDGEWENLHWPPGDEAAFMSPGGRYRLVGIPSEFRLELEGGARAGAVELMAGIEADGGLRFEAGQIGVGADLRWQADLEEEALHLAGTARLEVADEVVELRHHLESPALVETLARIDLSGRSPDFEVEGGWSGLRWPIAGEPEYESSEGRYRLAGTLEELQGRVAGHLRTAAGLAAELEVRMEGGVGETDSGEPSLDVHVGWWVEEGGGLRLEGGGQVAGTARGFTLHHRLAEPFLVETRATVDLPEGLAPSLTVEGRWADVAWPPADGAVRSDAGTYRLAGTLAEFALDVEAAVQAPGVVVERSRITLHGGVEEGAPHPFHLRLDWEIESDPYGALHGSGEAEGDLREVRLHHRLEAPFVLATRGRIDLQDPGPRVALEGEWRDLLWPPAEAGAVIVGSPSGSYRVDGPLERLELQVAGRVEAPALPAVEIDLTAHLEGDAVVLDALDLDTLGGRISAAGRVDLAESARLAFTLDARDVDPGQHWAEWPGRLELAARVEGQAEDAGWAISVDLERLGGVLREHPVEGRGRLAYRKESLEIDELRLASGPNRAEIDGAASAAEVDLRFALEVPAPESFAPGFEGRLSGEGRVRGAPDNPQVVASVRGDGLGWPEGSAERLRIEARLLPHDAAASGLQIEVDGIEVAGQAVREVRVSGEGNLASHRVNARIDAEAGSLVARVSGALNGAAWGGRLEGLDIDAGDAGRWRLAESAAVRAGAEQARLAPLCLVHSDARLCVEGGWRADGPWEGRLDLVRLPLELAKPWLPPEVTLTGALSGRGEARGSGDGLTGALRIVGVPGGIDYLPPGAAEPMRVGYRDLELSAALALDGGLEARVGVLLPELGRIAGTVEVSARDRAGSRRLGGGIDATIDDLTLVEAAVPALSEVRGRLDARASLAGTVERPEIRGRAALSGASARVPDGGLDLRELELTAQSDGGERVAFSGALTSGDGRLALSGQLILDAERGWPLELRIEGRDATVARLPQVEAVASPDLHFRADQGGTRVDGSVEIPRARIRISEVPAGAVRVSADEVLVGAEAPEAEPDGVPPSRVAARVEVLIGDDVRLEAFGLDTGLSGRLGLSSTPGGVPQAQGTLELVGGRFRAYGQDLTIEQGRLLFSGPIDNPALDVRATRRAGSVVAGIELTGSARDIRSRVFADPPMSEAEALAYLLTGRPLSGASSGDAALLTQAALNLGLERSQSVTQQIGAAVGLDEFTIGGGAGLEQSSLLLGKYLTPDLYVRYALGLFDNEGTLQLNYRLTDSLSVEAQSGASQGVDLIYSIEREQLFRRH